MQSWGYSVVENQTATGYVVIEGDFVFERLAAVSDTNHVSAVAAPSGNAADRHGDLVGQPKGTMEKPSHCLHCSCMLLQ